MKNTKIMAALAIFLAVALFIGAASATVVNVSTTTTIPSSEVINTAGTYTLNYTASQDPTGNMSVGTVASLPSGVMFSYAGNSLTTDSSGNVTIGSTQENGIYEGTYNFPAVKYVINVTTEPAKQSGEFAYDPALNAMVWTVTKGSGFAPQFPNQQYPAVDTEFKTADGKVATTKGATPIQIPEAGLYNYTTTDNTQTFYFQVALSSGPTPTPGADRNVAKGKDAFVFEHITVNNTVTSGKLIKFTDGQMPAVVNQISSDANGVFYLTEDVVGNNYGVYYLTDGWDPEAPYINIWYPELSIQAELTTNTATGATAGDSIDGKNVNKDTVVSFLINAPKVGPAYYNETAGTGATAKIVFTTPVSGKTTQFGKVDYNNKLLTASQTNAGWTAAGDNAAAGTYTAQAEYTSPQCFADYAKKSNTISFTLQSSTLTITAAKDSVVRSNPFTVTISGKAQTVYAVFIEDYKTTTDKIPTLQSGQSGYQSGSDMKTTDGQIAGANFKTDASGKRTIQFNTAENTEDKTYTIKVQGYDKDGKLDAGDYDKVKVKVEKGALTISASGDGSYYIGDEIKLTGTNTDSDLVFLFLTGQNLNANGIVLKDLPKKIDARLSENPVAVKTDDTWEYKWDTSKIALDTGAYTIYATSRLTNGKASDASDSTSKYATNGKAVKLSDSEYATVSVNLKQPFLSAVPSGTIIAQGDKLYVRGTAEGKPNNLMLYIFGPNFFEDHSITVEDDGTYEKKIDISNSMSSNQYFVVVQHPMYNNNFDAMLVDESDDYKYFQIVNSTTGGSQQGSFVVWGDNKLQGSQAADALTKMIDDANIDDIYTKLTFTVAAPWIRINSPGDQAAGSKFTISGTTNLAVDDQILVEVMSSSFTAVDKTSTSTTSGVSQTTKVVAGEGSDNTWSVDVDTTNWKLDQYTIKVNGIEVDVTTTTDFNLVEKLPDTPKPTETGAPATTTATTTATTAPTQTPGFGAFIALAGLGAVALLVLRRN
ncbi:PGF-CTERM sorting domain-containing protein [Methanocorpusculum sp. MG]|uniref:PGF-CTERM sorting domain-containing protein n=1 Tax=Methanocorpusculum petauri TaxID=3002863 RepID=A0ABT4IJC8_9EURY|nr:MEMAR_RS02690 family S-layer glycoprotein [Methanocorpusculum petauri]MCZ0861270.1 PGF-CTERM sorting domain-containing protein [Methanocorpusculum petauri]